MKKRKTLLNFILNFSDKRKLDKSTTVKLLEKIMSHKRCEYIIFRVFTDGFLKGELQLKDFDDVRRQIFDKISFNFALVEPVSSGVKRFLIFGMGRNGEYKNMFVKFETCLYKELFTRRITYGK